MAKATTKKVLGAYRTADGGWAAFDNFGRTWKVTSDEAAKLNARSAS